MYFWFAVKTKVHTHVKYRRSKLYTISLLYFCLFIQKYRRCRLLLNMQTFSRKEDQRARTHWSLISFHVRLFSHCDTCLLSTSTCLWEFLSVFPPKYRQWLLRCVLSLFFFLENDTGSIHWIKWLITLHSILRCLVSTVQW